MEFQSKQTAQKAYYTAQKVLPLVKQYFPTIKSVIDIGCGRGAWLAVAKQLGINERIVGIDGYFEEENAWIEEKYIIRENFSATTEHNYTYDIAICLEFAEHLTAEVGEKLIAYLCKSSSVILFSASIPFENDNKNHLNEQWLSYWVEKFQRYHFAPLDIIRAQIWNDDEIPFWYKHGILVFVPEGEKNRDLINTYRPLLLDIVHPEALQYKNNLLRTYKKINNAPKSVKNALMILLRAIKYKITRLWRHK